MRLPIGAAGIVTALGDQHVLDQKGDYFGQARCRLLTVGKAGDAFVLIYSYLVARETDDQFQVKVLNTVDYRLNEQLRGLTVRRRGAPSLDFRSRATLFLPRFSQA